MQIDRNGVVVDKVLLWAVHSDIWKLLAPAGRALLLPGSVLGSGAQPQLSYPSTPRKKYTPKTGACDVSSFEKTFLCQSDP